MVLFDLTRSRGGHIAATGALGFGGLLYSFWAWNPVWYLVSLAVTAFFVVVLLEAYFHRYCSHGMFKLRRGLEPVLAFLGTVVPATGSPAGWAAVHKAHHEHSDTELDPHSPEHMNFWQMLTMQYGNTGDIQTSRKLLKSAWHRALHRGYLFWLSLWAGLWYVLLGSEGLVYIVLIPWFMAAFLSTFVNYFVHKDIPGSYRNFPTRDNSQNSWIVGLVTFFACWLHNTHHAHPSWADMKVRWFEIDTAWWVIRAIRAKD